MIRAYVDALNRGDESYLEEYFGPGYVYHGPDGDLDAEGFKALHHSLLNAFPGGTMTADDILVAGDEVATRWRFHGIHSGEFQGVAPTGLRRGVGADRPPRPDAAARRAPPSRRWGGALMFAGDVHGAESPDHRWYSDTVGRRRERPPTDSPCAGRGGAR